MTTLDWQKSSFSSDQANCLEISRDGDTILVRESDDPDQVVTTTVANLAVFLKGAKAGEFDHFAV
ncbi:hypothetical protein P3T37_005365 [Kitasatospora sp. MAA4]|uniref:DUF397 domain-containing protein n=1 Tax=Kitasatospora sp. MAA4 TaxID=3035093 RepID=UPI0024739BF9|nr:DUF397 domain-containing protein [Kitasatospora sp. MAA4]MDH6135946.1 hypothetical protein [Kitasatospora sp. MAA4]